LNIVFAKQSLHNQYYFLGCFSRLRQDRNDGLLRQLLYFTIVADIQPPAYQRYGKTLGNQFSKPGTVAFDNDQIKSGQK
jgi:hypothetical protein